MKILFIENRQKTFFWEKIAEGLSDKHTIHWLVQNKVFIPSEKKNIHLIEYPKKKVSYEPDQSVEKIISIDRQINHFAQKEKSYFYYYNKKIEKILIAIKPDVVFGESTAFHELLTIENCKKLNIKYLNPSTSRYPKGRFAFYEYDTLKPFIGSNDSIDRNEINQIIENITEHKTLPDYMKLKKPSIIDRTLDKILKVYAYYRGDKFNTPNPFIKFSKELNKKRLKELWEISSSSLSDIETNSFICLYPLQFQPEANIDVWGYKFRDQVALINSISDSIPKNTLLVIKPNPKSHYEINQNLIDLINSKSNIIALNHSSQMESILQKTHLVITVTGTIAIECIIKNKPVITLINTINNDADNCLFVHKIEQELPKVIKKIQNRSFPKINHLDKENFISHLNKISYKGLISDPFTDKRCVEHNNIEDVVNAFRKICEKI